jgi:hypothetical protein
MSWSLVDVCFQLQKRQTMLQPSRSSADSSSVRSPCVSRYLPDECVSDVEHTTEKSMLSLGGALHIFGFPGTGFGAG